MIEKQPFIYRLTKQVIHSYEERHSVTGTQHFAPQMGFKGDNADQQLNNTLNTTSYNPVAPKRLSVDHLWLFLESLDEIGMREWLERFNNHWGYGTMRIRTGVDVTLDVLSVFDSLLAIDEKHGGLAQIIREAIQDGEIDEDEKSKIKAAAYELRRMATTLEELSDV